MAFYHRSSEKRRLYHDFRRQEEEVIGSLCRLGNRPVSPKSQLEQEKRIRREIANSNERRRMQSINAGFQSLRALLPHHEGEKLSKAAILQQTAEFIYQLEQEKTRLLSQNSQLKRLINSQLGQESDNSSSDSPLPKKCKLETVESADEGIGVMSPTRTEPSVDELKREMIDLRLQLERERRLRMVLEDQTRQLQAQLYPERIREIAHQVQMQYQQQHVKEKDVDDESKQLPETPPPSADHHPAATTDPSTNPAQTELALPQVTETPHDLSNKPLHSHIVSVPQTAYVQAPSPSNTLVVPMVEQQSIVEHQTITVVTEEPPPPPPPQPPAIQQPRLYHASTSRQNLETIVEAIRHLEGDHLFRDDPEPELNSRLEAADRRNETKDEETADQKRLSVNGGGPSCVNEYATIRQQVIQCQMSRPGVIVANHA